MKPKKRNLYLGIVCSLALALCILSCEKFSNREENLAISEEYAIKKAKHFCERFDIQCNGIKKGESHQIGYLSWMFYGEYPRLHFYDEDYFRGQSILFEDESAAKKGIVGYYILFIVRDKSKEVERYANYAILERYIKQYGFSYKTGRFRWPEFLPEKKAREIIDSIANKLEMPSDMVFYKIEKHEEYGLWNAMWLRQRNGYKYEGDAISMSIMGATGEFVAYVKTYRGVPTSTEMKISKEEAIEIGWRKLQKYFTWKLQKIGEKARGLYAIDAEPLIIQTGPFGPAFKTIKIEGSKLAWVIRYKFTGGFEEPGKSLPRKDWTEKDRKAFALFYKSMDKKWREFGAPDQNFEIRIDAATGKILYSSPMRPWYMRWSGELTIER